MAARPKGLLHDLEPFPRGSLAPSGAFSKIASHENQSEETTGLNDPLFDLKRQREGVNALRPCAATFSAVKSSREKK